jgi:hypothetical protein
MLINNKKEILVWQPFKNYSTSIGKYLLNNKIFNENKFIFVQGPVPYLAKDVKEPDAEPGLGHTNWFPKRSTNYLKLLPIRDPYSRVVSQWKQALKNFKDIEFDEWLMIHSKQLIKFPVTKIYEYDELIRVEDIENELRKFHLFNEDYTFPHSNKSDIRNDFQLTQKQKDMIYYLHYSDFIEGGYEK